MRIILFTYNILKLQRQLYEVTQMGRGTIMYGAREQIN